MNDSLSMEMQSFQTKQILAMKKITENILQYPKHWRNFRKKSYSESKFFLKVRAVIERDDMLSEVIRRKGFVNYDVFSQIVVGQFGMKNAEDFFNWSYYRLLAFQEFHSKIGIRQEPINRQARINEYAKNRIVKKK